MRDEFTPWIDAEDSLVLEVLDLFHAQMTFLANFHCFHHCLAALSSPELRFLRPNWPMTNYHVLRESAAWKFCSEVLFKPANLQGKSVPRSNVEHFGDDPEVVVEVTFVWFLPLNARDRLQPSTRFRFLPGPFKAKGGDVIGEVVNNHDHRPRTWNS